MTAMVTNADRASPADAPMSSWKDKLPSAATWRLYSGLVLFVYLMVHLINHSFGLLSLEWMSWVGAWVKGFWRFPPMSIALYGALIVHTVLCFWSIFQRRSIKMRWQDWFQIISGLAIPLIMMTHIVGTRGGAELYGLNDTYAYVLFSTFVAAPDNAWLNTAGLIVAWLHGCLGLYMWMRLKRWFSPYLRNASLVCLVALPILALTGYLSAGREVAVLATSGEWLEVYYRELNLISDDVWGWMGANILVGRQVFLGMLGVLALAVLGRYVMYARQKLVTITYVDGPEVRVPIGSNLLEISRGQGIDHASVCGGRGRCSTCRVRVLASDKPLPAATEDERKVLSRVRAPSDIRLACQLTPQSNMKVVRVLPEDTTMDEGMRPEPWATGEERTVAILFADLREFTRTSENKLPFDVVYLINQFSSTMGKAVEKNNGRIDKFLGDGLMAIFGIESTPEEGARDALTATRNMRRRLARLNEQLKDDLDEPLRMGIGIHTGSVVLGKMGYGASRGLTAIGDTVNTASRLEAETKAHACALCISDTALELTGVKMPDSLRKKIEVRGKREPLTIYALADEDLLKTEPQAATTAQQ